MVPASENTAGDGYRSLLLYPVIQHQQLPLKLLVSTSEARSHRCAITGNIFGGGSTSRMESNRINRDDQEATLAVQLTHSVLWQCNLHILC